MAESVVSFVIERLGSVVDQEAELLQNVRDEVISIRFDFEIIKVRLKDAERQAEMEEQGDEEAKTWLKDLRHVAFDIEDTLDEYVLRHQARQLRRHQHGTCGWLNNAKFFFKIRSSQRELATQIGSIKIRLQNISSTKERYTPLASSDVPRKMIERDPRRHDSFFIQVDRVVGFDAPRNQINGWLLDDQALELVVVSIFGMGGLGKTTLVKKVYESPEVKAKFPHRLWVTVSQRFQIKSLLRDLILQLLDEEEKETLSDQLKRIDDITQLTEMLRDRLSNNKYVMVLDDIWDLNAWRSLKCALPDSSGGSRILVTTRSHEIAQGCMENPACHTYQLQPLQDDDAWGLFQIVALKSHSHDDHSYETSHLKDVSQKFLSKCKGVPLAIISIAGLLSTKDINEWEQIPGDPRSLFYHPSLDDVKTILLLSYDDLPHHLKSCLLYLCIYPEDYSINCLSIVRLWAAEGFADHETKPGVSAITREDCTKKYLDELIARSLIQVGEVEATGRVRTCRIHDILHEFLRTKAREQEFVEFADQSADIKPYGRRLSINDTSSSSSSSSSRHDQENTLSISENSITHHIRSLLVWGGSSVFGSASVTILNRVRLLKVLDLEGADLREDFQIEAVTNLSFLRYLSFRGNSKIKSLPDSIGKLSNLETLDTKLTWIRELPPGIFKLKCLRHLLCYSKVPAGISSMITLEKLRRVHSYNGIGKELEKLTRLRSLTVDKLDGTEGRDVLASLQKMKYLRSCCLWTVHSETPILDVPNLPNPPPLLQRLYLVGCLSKSPMWIPKLSNLVKLLLAESKLKDTSYFYSLQSLHKLLILKLDMEAFDGMESLMFPKGVFPRLRYLGLYGFPKLECIRVEERAMPCIQEMGLLDCPRLNEVPMGIEHLTTLSKITLYQVPTQLEDALRNHCQNTGTCQLNTRNALQRHYEM